jgi:hypothetical protein
MEKWQRERLERLRKEQRKEQERPVLHAPRPQPPMWEERPKEKPPERGVAIIDFNL